MKRHDKTFLLATPFTERAGRACRLQAIPGWEEA